MPLISFSCFFVQPKASSTILKRNRDNGQTCLVPDFNGVASGFSPLRIMLAVCLPHIAFIMLGMFPPVLLCLELLS